ncbi:MAG: diacylglycerol kinase family protein [Candidatus Kerfeldbacteria bacterium]|nr:diacylglycerol kinase family protein [Candidatus Kerfeldbacteria bacterium]
MSPISLRRFWKSLRYALQGLQRAADGENSFRLHALIAVFVVIAILVFQVHRLEAAILILVISSILTLELVNTVVEKFSGMLEPRIHPYVGLIKDFMAGAVLLMSIAAVTIGVLILWPYLWTFIQGLS